MKDFFESFPLKLFLWNTFWYLLIIFTLFMIKWQDENIKSVVHVLIFVAIVFWSGGTVYLIKKSYE